MRKGELVVLGVIQEQHAERCRLFAQWQGFEWPIVQDSFTEIGLAVVPVAVLIDEYGIVISNRPRRNEITDLVAQSTKPPAVAAPKLSANETTVEFKTELFKQNKAEPIARVGMADAILKWQPKQVASAIEHYRKAAAALGAKHELANAIRFRLGVAYRKLFDLEGGKSTQQFQLASESWSAALAGNPNQYIWRRRIQQYGPGLSKPYPFYDWVEKATSEIAARGETPIALTVPLTGSEISAKQKRFKRASSTSENPDPNREITADSSLVLVEASLVPAEPKPGDTVRVYLHFQTQGGKWNNESTPMQIWIEPSGGESNKRLIEVQNGKSATSTESRWVEFEFQLDKAASQATISGFALFNVCEADDGACLFRRKEFKIPVF